MTWNAPLPRRSEVGRQPGPQAHRRLQVTRNHLTHQTSPDDGRWFSRLLNGNPESQPGGLWSATLQKEGANET